MRTRVVISTTVAAMGLAAALAAPAGAVVNGSHVVAVIPQSSTLELTGYPPGAHLTVQAVRDGVVIGNATTDALPDGTGGVNPVSCWIGTTPQLLPGDTVTVDTPGQPQDSMVVQNITATTMEQAANGDILVHGVAIAPGGGPDDAATFAASVQARISRPAGGTRPIVSSLRPTRKTPSKFFEESASAASVALTG